VDGASRSLGVTQDARGINLAFKACEEGPSARSSQLAAVVHGVEPVRAHAPIKDAKAGRELAVRHGSH
jgi:hypothetical protein